MMYIPRHMQILRDAIKTIENKLWKKQYALVYQFFILLILIPLKFLKCTSSSYL